MSYTSAYNLPKEALTVKARVKTLDSFLKKLKKRAGPYLTIPRPSSMILLVLGSPAGFWMIVPVF
jgi:hypothetical protein